MMEPPGVAFMVMVAASSGGQLHGLDRLARGRYMLGGRDATEARYQLLRGAHHAVREEEDDGHEHPAQDEDPEIRVVRGQQALEPVDAEGSHHRPDESPPPAHGDPDDHLDGGEN